MKKANAPKRTIPSFLLGIIAIIIIALLLIDALKALIKSNELSEKRDVLIAEHEEVEYENQRLNNELEKPLDDEAIKDIAQKELGYADPNAEYYYSN